MQITASQLENLLEILYTLVIDYREVGGSKASVEVAAQLKQLLPRADKLWSRDLPLLPDTVRSSIAGGSRKVSNLVMLGQEIKEQFQTLRANEEFTASELTALNAAGAYLRTDSEPAFKKLMQLASLSGSVWVSQRMKPKVGNQGSVQKELEKIVFKMVGRKDTALTLEESAVAKASYPELYKEYLALRRGYNQVWKDAIVSYVRSTGQPLVPYKDLRDHLDSRGIKYSLVDGFTGMIDDQGRFYTSKGKLIDGVPSATNFPTVVMNPQYPKVPWVFQAIRPSGDSGQYFYTRDFKKSQAKKKFEQVKALSAKMPGMRRKWMSHVRTFKVNDQTSLAAVILELLHEFSARVGTVGNSTYGIGTLLVRHVHEQTNGDLWIKYKGKDSVPHKHVLRMSNKDHKFLIDAIHQLMEGKEPKDRLFITPDNKVVGPATSNKYFKALSGLPLATVHKIRTYRGTSLFEQLMAEVIPKLEQKVKLTEADVNHAFKIMTEKVGKLLNHVRRGADATKVTGMTAIQNYIDGSSMTEFFRALNMRPPPIIEKLASRPDA